MSAALAHSARLAAARSDTAAAVARTITAAALPDPSLSLQYTADIPNYHATVQMPLDEIWLRGIRIRAANADRLASRYRQAYEVASVTLDVDTSYTRALAALAHVRLSERNAVASDSLRSIAAARLAAGDASQLELETASLAAGVQANAAASDSVTLANALMTLKSLTGLDVSRGAVMLVDSLAPVSAPDMVIPAQSPLLVAGSAAALEAADLTAQVQRRGRFGSPGLLVGFDAGYPNGERTGLQPTVGVAVPLPIFNRNRGPIAEAEAQRGAAAAQLEIARVESALEIDRAEGAARGATARLARDQQLLRGADRVAALSLTAYREGAAPLASVLEAQRSARDVQAQYIDDVAAALIASATLHLLTLTPATVTP